jgi:FkbM family methyltransferase
MKVIFHYFKILKIIFKSDYETGNLKILLCYSKLFFKSVFHHKVKKNRRPIQTENMLGFNVSFFSYGQLLDLFEEIFIYEVYKFSSTKKSPLIVDCGSNIGMSVLYFKLIFPAGKIMAFEPHPASFNLLHENVAANDIADVSLFNFALGDLDQTALLHNEEGEDTLTMSLFRNEANATSEKINVKKLSDHVHGKIDLVKIDVEGSEDKIIIDLVQTGKIDLVEKMIIEYHPELTATSVDKFVALLSKNGLAYSASKNQLHPEASEILIYCDRQ